MKQNLIRLNACAIISLSIGLALSEKMGQPLLLNIVGIVYLLFIFPFTLLSVAPFSLFSRIDRFLLCPVIFFSFFTPFYFFLNKTLAFTITPLHTIFLLAVTSISALIISIFRHSDTVVFSIPLLESIKKSFYSERVFIFTLLAFLGIHALNYHFYGFIPEWDGYANIIRAEQSIETGVVQQSYRGFFDTSVMILSGFSNIDPYHIFSVVFILLQVTTFFSIRFFLGRYRITSPLYSAIIYLIALSVPVLTMEIDMTRPQNVFVILLPIFFVFSYRFLVEGHSPSAVIAFIIALSGIGYHEFFIFPLFISFIYAIISVLRFAKHSQDKRDRIIATLLFLLIFLSATLAIDHIGFVSGAISVAERIIVDISAISKWRLWFIDNYSGDGSAETGWAGVSGAAKYYGYYLSPILAGVFILTFISIIRKRALLSDVFIRLVLSFILIFFSFAEILPRMNHLYLPERFWLLIDICLIFLTIPLVAYFQKTLSRNRFLLMGIVLLSLIGLGGSIYVAQGKKSLTSPSEYRAAIWIRNNTPENSSIITQGANGPMILFFARRTLIDTSPEYFLSPLLLMENFEPKEKLANLRYTHDAIAITIHSEVDQYTRNEIPLSVFIKELQDQESQLKSLEKEINTLENSAETPMYIVYSFDKFDTIYTNRTWWMNTNAYGANLEKFNQVYPLVYKKDGVFIWKIR